MNTYVSGPTFKKMLNYVYFSHNKKYKYTPSTLCILRQSIFTYIFFMGKIHIAGACGIN